MLEDEPDCRACESRGREIVFVCKSRERMDWRKEERVREGSFLS